ncbi:unnamed protein product [Paramecium sonneborni]|uniref:Uncharacterized protein n=1 Tax=Paramecium sonneborni TaxID=65129 RepID=A0A8S1L8R7_9CILI|nr:unnamed protein product [Paramecium sonneborni]
MMLIEKLLAFLPTEINPSLINQQVWIEQQISINQKEKENKERVKLNGNKRAFLFHVKFILNFLM